MLKELITSLSILVVSYKDETRSYIGKDYLKFCKKLQIVETLEEAKNICDSEEIELIVVNADLFGRKTLEFVEQNIKNNMHQHIIVSARQFNQPSILIQFANLGVDGFISKSSPLEEVFPMLLRVCTQIQEQSILTHYVKDLEEQVKEMSQISSITIKHEAPIHTHEEFELFPSTTTYNSSGESSVYKDYFTFLMGDDKDELHDILSEIDVLVLNVQNQSFGNNAELLIILGGMLSRFGNTLMHYQFFSDAGIAIVELGQTIVSNSQIEGSKVHQFDTFVSGFCAVLQNFIDEVWEKEASDPKFYNDSIVTDAQMICEFIVPSQSHSSAQETDDLIFF